MSLNPTLLQPTTPQHQQHRRLTRKLSTLSVATTSSSKGASGAASVNHGASSSSPPPSPPPPSSGGAPHRSNASSSRGHHNNSDPHLARSYNSNHSSSTMGAAKSIHPHHHHHHHQQHHSTASSSLARPALLVTTAPKVPATTMAASAVSKSGMKHHSNQQASSDGALTAMSQQQQHQRLFLQQLTPQQMQQAAFAEQEAIKAKLEHLRADPDEFGRMNHLTEQLRLRALKFPLPKSTWSLLALREEEEQQYQLATTASTKTGGDFLLSSASASFNNKMMSSSLKGASGSLVALTALSAPDFCKKHAIRRFVDTSRNGGRSLTGAAVWPSQTQLVAASRMLLKALQPQLDKKKVWRRLYLLRRVLMPALRRWVVKRRRLIARMAARWAEADQLKGERDVARQFDAAAAVAGFVPNVSAITVAAAAEGIFNTSSIGFNASMIAAVTGGGVGGSGGGGFPSVAGAGAAATVAPTSVAFGSSAGAASAVTVVGRFTATIEELVDRATTQAGASVALADRRKVVALWLTDENHQLLRARRRWHAKHKQAVIAVREFSAYHFGSHLLVPYVLSRVGVPPPPASGASELSVLFDAQILRDRYQRERKECEWAEAERLRREEQASLTARLDQLKAKMEEERLHAKKNAAAKRAALIAAAAAGTSSSRLIAASSSNRRATPNTTATATTSGLGELSTPETGGISQDSCFSSQLHQPHLLAASNNNVTDISSSGNNNNNRVGTAEPTSENYSQQKQQQQPKQDLVNGKSVTNISFDDTSMDRETLKSIFALTTATAAAENTSPLWASPSDNVMMAAVAAASASPRRRGTLAPGHTPRLINRTTSGMAIPASSSFSSAANLSSLAQLKRQLTPPALQHAIAAAAQRPPPAESLLRVSPIVRRVKQSSPPPSYCERVQETAALEMEMAACAAVGDINLLEREQWMRPLETHIFSSDKRLVPPTEVTRYVDLYREAKNPRSGRGVDVLFDFSAVRAASNAAALASTTSTTARGKKNGGNDNKNNTNSHQHQHDASGDIKNPSVINEAKRKRASVFGGGSSHKAQKDAAALLDESTVETVTEWRAGAAASSSTNKNSSSSTGRMDRSRSLVNAGASGSLDKQQQQQQQQQLPQVRRPTNNETVERSFGDVGAKALPVSLRNNRYVVGLSARSKQQQQQLDDAAASNAGGLTTTKIRHASFAPETDRVTPQTAPQKMDGLQKNRAKSNKSSVVPSSSRLPALEATNLKLQPQKASIGMFALALKRGGVNLKL